MNLDNRKIFLILAILLVVVFFVDFIDFKRSNFISESEINNNTVEEDKIEQEKNDIEILAEGLEIPWDIVFLPDGDVLVTERPGNILRIDPEGNREQIFRETYIDSAEYSVQVQHVGEGGLLGITLHPDFEENNLLYIYRTVRAEAGDNYINIIDQYKLVGNKLEKGEATDFNFYDQIPGAPYHDGGRIEVGPDDKLYITVGDATNEDWAQVYSSDNSIVDYAGSILRINLDGSIPEDNPFGNAVWSYGHRNPQGIAWDNEGRLWSTEHGRSGIRSGFDEINLIKKGENYGWPDSQGDTVLGNTTGPRLHSGSSYTWAPASALYWDGSLFFGGLRGEALFEAVIEEEEVVEIKEHFKGEFGRIRTVKLGPDNYFYITTSNRDGRGSVNEGDDKIIKIHSSYFRE